MLHWSDVRSLPQCLHLMKKDKACIAVQLCGELLPVECGCTSWTLRMAVFGGEQLLNLVNKEFAVWEKAETIVRVDYGEWIH